MQALTRERLSANAYRTLGLSAAARQADIDAAARRMRIWPDASRIPPTPWDLPFLGPVLRSRGEIEQAVARLHDPLARLEERLLWYACAAPPARVDPAAATSIDRVGDAATVAERHAAALSTLHAAALYAMPAQQGNLYRNAMGGFRRLCGSDDFLAWVSESESAGDFEKPASLDEVYGAVRSIPSAMAEALVPLARAALDRNDTQGCAALVSIIREGDADSGGGSLGRLADALEDALDGHCRAIDVELRDVLRTRREAPEPFYVANHNATLKAARAYNAQVDPALARLRAVVGDDVNRMTRAKSRCADLLSLLALGWEWSGQFITAEQTLLTALELAAGSAGEAAIRKDLERVRPRAEHERLRATAVRDQPAAAWHARAAARAAAIAGDLNQPQFARPALPPRSVPRAKPNRKALGWGSGVAIFLLLRVVASIVETSSSPTAGTPTRRSYSPTGTSSGELNATIRQLQLSQRQQQSTNSPSGPAAPDGSFNPDADPTTPPPPPPAPGGRPPRRIDSIGEVNREP